MTKPRLFTSACCFLLATLAPRMAAAECGGLTQTFRLVPRTVFEQRQVTAYRTVTETIYEDKPVTSFRPVWETQMQERRYTVARPIMETSEREERFTVRRQVWDTVIEDRSYDQVRNVVETSEREERFVVQRPVIETSEREEQHVVRRQIVETAERDEVYTVHEPVTTMTCRMVDKGAFVDQTVVHPGAVRNRLRWVPAHCAIDPATGQSVVQRAGFAWVPEQQPNTVTVNRVWQPNVVQEQVPVTQLVARQVTRKVPVQVCRYVDEVVVRKVPVQTCRMVQGKFAGRYKPCVSDRTSRRQRVCRFVDEQWRQCPCKRRTV